MKVLEFMDIGATTPSGDFRPLARSSMHRRLEEHRARFEERDGWLVATRVPGEEGHELGVRDLTHAYAVHEGGNGGWIEVGEHVLRHSVESGHVFVATPRAQAAEPPEGFLDMTAAYAALEIAGPGAETLMRRLTALDLDDLPNVGPVAHVRSFVFRTGEDAFLLFFGQEYGHYLWEVVVDSAEPLGGGPSGSR